MSSALHTENPDLLAPPRNRAATASPHSLRAATTILVAIAAQSLALPWLWLQSLVAFDNNLFIPPSHNLNHLPWILTIAVVGSATALTLAWLLHRRSYPAYLVTLALTGALALGFVANQVVFTPDPISMIMVMNTLALLIPLTSTSLSQLFLGPDHQQYAARHSRVSGEWRSVNFLLLTVALALCFAIMLIARRWPVVPSLMESSVVTGAAHTARPLNPNLAILCAVLFALMVFTAVMLWKDYVWAQALALGMAASCLVLFCFFSTSSLQLAPISLGILSAVVAIGLTGRMKRPGPQPATAPQATTR